MANVAKSNTMTCELGSICNGMPEEVFSRKSTGDGATYQERLQWCIPCPYYGVDLMDGSMTAHHIQLYET